MSPVQNPNRHGDQSTKPCVILIGTQFPNFRIGETTTSNRENSPNTNPNVKNSVGNPNRINSVTNSNVTKSFEIS